MERSWCRVGGSGVHRLVQSPEFIWQRLRFQEGDRNSDSPGWEAISVLTSACLGASHTGAITPTQHLSILNCFCCCSAACCFWLVYPPSATNVFGLNSIAMCDLFVGGQRVPS